MLRSTTFIEPTHIDCDTVRWPEIRMWLDSVSAPWDVVSSEHVFKYPYKCKFVWGRTDSPHVAMIVLTLWEYQGRCVLEWQCRHGDRILSRDGFRLLEQWLHGGTYNEPSQPKSPLIRRPSPHTMAQTWSAFHHMTRAPYIDVVSEACCGFADWYIENQDWITDRMDDHIRRVMKSLLTFHSSQEDDVYSQLYIVRPCRWILRLQRRKRTKTKKKLTDVGTFP